MWLLFGFISAFLLGCYDICKKTSVDGNAVLPVLLTSMVCSTLLQIPLAITQIPVLDAHTHLLIFIKACLIMSFGLTTWNKKSAAHHSIAHWGHWTYVGGDGSRNAVW